MKTIKVQDGMFTREALNVSFEKENLPEAKAALKKLAEEHNRLQDPYYLIDLYRLRPRAQDPVDDTVRTTRYLQPREGPDDRPVAERKMS